MGNTISCKFEQKNFKIVSSSWSLVPRLTRISRSQGWSSFFLFETGNTLFGQKFCPKNHSCQLQLKCGTKANSNVRKSMVVFTFCILDGKQRFCASLVQNIKNVSLNWNLLPRLINNLNMQNSLLVFTFSVLDQKHSF